MIAPLAWRLEINFSSAGLQELWKIQAIRIAGSSSIWLQLLVQCLHSSQCFAALSWPLLYLVKGHGGFGPPLACSRSPASSGCTCRGCTNFWLLSLTPGCRRRRDFFVIAGPDQSTRFGVPQHGLCQCEASEKVHSKKCLEYERGWACSSWSDVSSFVCMSCPVKCIYSELTVQCSLTVTLLMTP